MNINIPNATVSQCTEYSDAESAGKQKTVVITPLRITILAENHCKISFGCNFWKSCSNENCSFCSANMRPGIYEDEQRK